MCNPHLYFGPRRFSELECLGAVRLISQYSNDSEINFESHGCAAARDRQHFPIMDHLLVPRTSILGGLMCF